MLLLSIKQISLKIAAIRQSKAVLAQMFGLMGILGLLSACSDAYVPQPKSMVTVKQHYFHHALRGESADIEPYAVEALENKLRSIPLQHITGAEIISNSPAFVHSKANEQIQLALWRKGIDRKDVMQRLLENEASPIVQLVVHYRDIGKPDPCPDWRHSAAQNFDNSLMSNYGCATALNQNLMLAHRRDVLESRGNPAAITESSVGAVQRMHQGEFLLRGPDYSSVTSDVQ